jgi:hypothetical protein
VGKKHKLRQRERQAVDLTSPDAVAQLTREAVAPITQKMAANQRLLKSQAAVLQKIARS